MNRDRKIKFEVMIQIITLKYNSITMKHLNPKMLYLGIVSNIRTIRMKAYYESVQNFTTTTIKSIGSTNDGLSVLYCTLFQPAQHPGEDLPTTLRSVGNLYKGVQKFLNTHKYPQIYIRKMILKLAK